MKDTENHTVDFVETQTLQHPDQPKVITRESETTSSSAPRTRMECLVAKCWEDVLKVTGVGLEDEFFALGGNPLQAVQMVFTLQKLLPAPAPLLVALFLQYPMLGAFANAIEEKLGGQALAAGSGI